MHILRQLTRVVPDGLERPAETLSRRRPEADGAKGEGTTETSLAAAAST